MGVRHNIVPDSLPHPHPKKGKIQKSVPRRLSIAWFYLLGDNVSWRQSSRHADKCTVIYFMRVCFAFDLRAEEDKNGRGKKTKKLNPRNVPYVELCAVGHKNVIK